MDDLNWIDGLGVIGSLLICGGYFAVSSGKLQAERTGFQLLNLAGAGLLLVSLYFRPNPGAIVIEVLWVGIALWTLARIWLGRT